MQIPLSQTNACNKATGIRVCIGEPSGRHDDSITRHWSLYKVITGDTGTIWRIKEVHSATELSHFVSNLELINKYPVTGFVFVLSSYETTPGYKFYLTQTFKTSYAAPKIASAHRANFLTDERSV